jgi:hypothetical protein
MAAGLGFKTFTTGEVLTAADTNGYLMQGINVFASTAARDAAITSPQEGQFAYTKDTNSLWYYTGSAWAASGATGDIEGVTAGIGISGGGTSGTVTVTNSMATAIDAKGDLIAGTGADTFDRLAVGNNGETLVADSSTSTGLRYTENYAAGKNAIINGALNINQRNFTSNTANASFNFDRFSQLNSGGTVTVTPQTFTAGAAPVAGYEATNFVRMVTASQSAAGDFAIMRYAVEDVRTNANQTATISFWAKAASGTPKITVEIDQNFGSGGSAPSITTTFGTVTLSTSWARYTVTGTVPSISGKTIGAGSYLTLYFWVSAGTTYAARTNSMGVQNNTFDLWGFQLEEGSVATAFQTATGTIQGELAACQRYYHLLASGTTKVIGPAFMFGVNQADATISFVTTMRTAPTLIATSGTAYYAFDRANGTDTFDSITIYAASTNTCLFYNNVDFVGTGGDAGYWYTNNAAASVAFNAEL